MKHSDLADDLRRTFQRAAVKRTSEQPPTGISPSRKSPEPDIEYWMRQGEPS